MKTYGEVCVYIHVFLTSALVGVKWLVSRSGRFTHGRRAPRYRSYEGSVSPRTGLDAVEKIKFLALLGLELRTVACPVRRQSLYRQR